ncbi:ATP-binding cassette domain-containing protein [Pseudodesulfovibrio piezophilus]|uniref:ABC transporter related protein n=1 Tax=Pseudodesulfovibrio piezophilus (strain DSM 21447 / JCM 15486 / C1TLV30) TaxID=1322246 RepID=M1WV77_PSEP2|nr:ABC transporter related protein [Pseudodesulfovibrio piezophilus C1TLV30]
MKVKNVLMHPLIQLEGVSVRRNGTRLVGSLSMQLLRGEHVAVVGHNGSGKTTLLKLLRGDILPDPGGVRVYDLGDGPQPTVLGLRQRIGLVSADMQDFYFLHARRSVGRTVVLAGFFDTPLLYEQASPQQEAAADEIIALLGIEELAASELGTLSTGQVRKLLIARALAPRPDILLLDECLEGLDVVSRAEVLSLLDTAGEISTLVCAAHRIGDVPHSVNRAVIMHGGRIIMEGDREDALELLQESEPDVVACELPVHNEVDDVEFLVRMKNVSVVSGGVRFLHSVNWTVLPGENWIILGDNGAGKSTLLKLILSEIAPYADDAQGLGVVERLGGMPMDKARPRIGFVSPALQTGYGRELAWEVTALETVLSGYRGSVGMLDEPESAELLGAQDWLARVGLAELADRPLRRMSYGQQRRILLARAMASNPRLLLLDEPMAGLDSVSRSLMLGLLQQLADSGVPLVMVTHHVEDRIAAINHVMVMERGKQIFCGTREEFEGSVPMGMGS